MEKFKLEYNPYYVETRLWKYQNEGWVSVSNETGLMSIRRKRMQRWISTSDAQIAPCFFDNLRVASGEDDIEILFCGTIEDFDDLKVATENYSSIYDGVSITVYEDPQILQNSSSQKNRDLIDLIEIAQKSGYEYIFSDDIWKYLDECTKTDAEKVMVMPFTEWEKNKVSIFSERAWKLVCITLSMSEFYERNTKKSLQAFAENFAKFHDRTFEKDRLLLLCVFPCGAENKITSYDYQVKRLLLECGIPDLSYMFLSTETVDCLLNERNVWSEDEYLVSVQEKINLFTNRYAEQYRLRIMHDALCEMLNNAGFVEGSSLFRLVEEQLHAHQISAHDNDVMNAYEWTIRFLENIRNLLNITAQ